MNITYDFIVTPTREKFKITADLNFSNLLHKDRVIFHKGRGFIITDVLMKINTLTDDSFIGVSDFVVVVTETEA